MRKTATAFTVTNSNIYSKTISILLKLLSIKSIKNAKNILIICTINSIVKSSRHLIYYLIQYLITKNLI